MSGSSRLPLIHRQSGQPDRSRKLGPYQIESLIEAAEEGAGTVYRVRIEPHSSTSVSLHKVAEEYYFVLSGTGTAFLDGVPHAISRHDFLRLPPSTAHAFTAGEDPLELLNIHTPGCRPDRDTFFVGEVPDGFGS